MKSNCKLLLTLLSISLVITLTGCSYEKAVPDDNSTTSESISDSTEDDNIIVRNTNGCVVKEKPLSKGKSEYNISCDNDVVLSFIGLSNIGDEADFNSDNVLRLIDDDIWLSFLFFELGDMSNNDAVSYCENGFNVTVTDVKSLDDKNTLLTVENDELVGYILTIKTDKSTYLLYIATKYSDNLKYCNEIIDTSIIYNRKGGDI